MATAIVNGRVMIRDEVREDVCVVLDGERISQVGGEPPSQAQIVDLAGQVLLPGFIDVQVNGGGGRLFNDDPSVETIQIMASAHRRFGTTGMLPTLISDDIATIERAIGAVDSAIECGVPGVLGIHIEGPFLNHKRRGIHLASKLQRIDDRFIEIICSARRGRTLVTLAPECVSPGQITRLVEAGVIVSAGHSDADYETVRAAIHAGLTGFTHLFNAMSQLTNRAPGMVGAALEDNATYAGIIIDGHHVHPATCRVGLKAKGAERMMLVTDAMPTVGTEVDDFVLQGQAIRLQGDRLVNEDGVLAGSTLTMSGAIRNAVQQASVPLIDAVRMATRTPATFLGLSAERGSIAAGMRADLVAITEDFSVSTTWINGERRDHNANVRTN